MPPKRKVDELTGGTGDVNPQFLSHTLSAASAGTTETVSLVAPISRYPALERGQSTILEILKVWFDFPKAPFIANVAESSVEIFASIGTVNAGGTQVKLNDPRVIAYQGRARRGAFSAGGTYSDSGDVGQPIAIELNDGAGHGILVATDTIYLQLGGSSSWATSVDFRMMYRLKTVGLEEYIGLVQSQQ